MPSPSGCAMPTASAPPARLLLRSRRPAHDHAGPLHARAPAGIAFREVSLPASSAGASPSARGGAVKAVDGGGEGWGEGYDEGWTEGWEEGWGERFRRLGWPASSGAPACLPKAAFTTARGCQTCPKSAGRRAAVPA